MAASLRHPDGLFGAVGELGYVELREELPARHGEQ